MESNQSRIEVSTDKERNRRKTKRGENELIYEFYKTESKHGKCATAYDIQMNGSSRKFFFCNNPKEQRLCKCQKCKTKIPREVPRIKFNASYHYGSGFYCMSCGLEILKAKLGDFRHVTTEIQKESKSIEEIMKIAEEVRADEFYEKKMSLGRLLQVMSEKGADVE